VRIASLYGDLVALSRSPIVELNRAVAVSMAHGPAAGLAVTNELLGVAALCIYHLLPSVRGDLLTKTAIRHLRRFITSTRDHARTRWRRHNLTPVVMRLHLDAAPAISYS
jgi:predicted RNA polymerase sigma factor